MARSENSPRTRRPRRRKLRKSAWLASFLMLLSGCALYSGQQMSVTPMPAPPPGSLLVSAPASQLPGLLERWPQLTEVLKMNHVDALATARQNPQATILMAVGRQPWPAEVHRQTAACHLRLQAAADALEEQYAQTGKYPGEATAVCPAGGKVAYEAQGEEFELTCAGQHHQTHYSSLTGFADAPKPGAPECALAVLPPAPVYPWWSPAHYTSSPPKPQVVTGPAELIAVPAQAGTVDIEARPELAASWLPPEMAGAVKGCSHVRFTYDPAGQRGEMRAFGAPGAPLASGDPKAWLSRLPDAPLALAYERSFAASLGLSLREPVPHCDSCASQLLDNWMQGAPGWVAWSSEVDLADWRHERGRLCAGRASAVGVSPDAPVKSGGPDLQVQQASDHTRVGLGQEPDGPALEWQGPENLPGAVGAAGRVRSRQLTVDKTEELRWAAGRDAQGLWLVFTAGEKPAPVAVAVPSQGPDVEDIYKRHLTVVAGR